MAELAFQLQVLHDELEAKLIVNYPVPGTLLTREALKEALTAENVFKGINLEAIEAAFEKLPLLEEPGDEFIIAQGKSPRNGKNGRIDFKVDVSGQATYNVAETEADTINFREATRLISVKPNEVLAELIPPSKGEPGFNLAGKELPARDGKPVVLRPGEGVETDKDMLIFRALVEGRPIFYAGTLSVSPIYEVPGDVDFNTGNIRFNGHVIVRGNVLDDFEIQAKSLEVLGVVGAANILCDGPLALRGGVNGRERAIIETQGSSSIKYINQATVIVKESLSVDREIVNATVWCRGRVKAEKIIGGSCLALGGVEVSLLGSEMGVSTVIEPGANYEVRKLDNELAELGEKLEALLRPLQTFLGDKARFRALPEDKKNDFQKSFEVFRTIKAQYIKLTKQRMDILTSEDSQPVKEVIVRKLVYPDVFVRTDLCMKQFKKSLTGPIALIEDVDSATIRPARYVPGQGIIEDEDEAEE